MSPVRPILPNKKISNIKEQFSTFSKYMIFDTGFFFIKLVSLLELACLVMHCAYYILVFLLSLIIVILTFLIFSFQLFSWFLYLVVLLFLFLFFFLVLLLLSLFFLHIQLLTIWYFSLTGYPISIRVGCSFILLASHLIALQR